MESQKDQTLKIILELCSNIFSRIDYSWIGIFRNIVVLFNVLKRFDYNKPFILKCLAQPKRYPIQYSTRIQVKMGPSTIKISPKYTQTTPLEGMQCCRERVRILELVYMAPLDNTPLLVSFLTSPSSSSWQSGRSVLTACFC